MSRTRHILVRSTNWIGDAVLSVAALRELRRVFRSDRLLLAARPWVAGLFRDQELVDEIFLLDEDYSGWRWLTRGPRADIDMAVLFPNAFRAALGPFLWRVPKRCGYATDGRSLLLTDRATPRIKKQNRHQVYYYLDLLYQTGLSEKNYLADESFSPDISLGIGDGDVAAARVLLEKAGGRPDRPLVGLNPGAFYGPAKRWFSDRYAVLADRVQEELGHQVVLFGSAEERDLAHRIESLMQTGPIILTGQTDLPTLMGALSLCRLLVTNDSGVMHLAAALQVPLVAIFGSTDEVATGPLSASSTVIHKHVECSPCLLRECPIDLRCFDRISVEEVFAAVQKHLSEPFAP